jgi:hypothetical protein
MSECALTLQPPSAGVTFGDVRLSIASSLHDTRLWERNGGGLVIGVVADDEHLLSRPLPGQPALLAHIEELVGWFITDFPGEVLLDLGELGVAHVGSDHERRVRRDLVTAAQSDDGQEQGLPDAAMPHHPIEESRSSGYARAPGSLHRRIPAAWAAGHPSAGGRLRLELQGRLSHRTQVLTPTDRHGTTSAVLDKDRVHGLLAVVSWIWLRRALRPPRRFLIRACPVNPHDPIATFGEADHELVLLVIDIPAEVARQPGARRGRSRPQTLVAHSRSIAGRPAERCRPRARRAAAHAGISVHGAPRRRTVPPRVARRASVVELVPQLRCR